MSRLIESADTLLRFLLMAALVVLVACVVWQVGTRYVFGRPSTLTDEIGRFTLMWFALLAAAYVLGQRRHLAIDLFAGLEVGPKRRFLALLLTALIAVMALVMLVGGLQLAAKTISSGQVTPVLRLQMGFVYLCVPVSAALMLIYCIDIARTALGPDARGPNDPASKGPDELLEGD